MTPTRRVLFFTFKLLDLVFTRVSLFRGLQIFHAFPGVLEFWRSRCFSARLCSSVSETRFFCEDLLLRALHSFSGVLAK